MRKLELVLRAQRFRGTHALVYTLFTLLWPPISATHNKKLRIRAFNEWSLAVARFWVLVYPGLEKLIWQSPFLARTMAGMTGTDT